MRVVFYSSKTDTEPSVVDLEWADLVEALADADEAPCTAETCEGTNCPHKDGPAWSPVDIAGTRKNSGVKSVSLAVLDLDHLTDEQVRDVARRLDGRRYVAHSTHQHRPPTDNRLRVVLPLSRPVPAGEWKRFHRALVTRLQVPADPACKDPSRLYFLPRPRAGTPFLHTSADGAPVDVDEILVKVAPKEKAAPPAPDEVFDVGTIREQVKAYVKTKERTRHADAEQQARDRGQAALLRAILECRKFAEPGARDATLNRAMTAMAFAVMPGTPFVAVAAIARPSIVAMAEPGDADDPYAHWLDEAEDMYGRAQVRRAELEAENEALKRASIEKWREYLTKRKERKATTAVETAAVVTIEEDDWRDLLKRARAGYVSSGYNVSIILQHAAEVGDIRWNVVTKKIEIVGGLFEGDDPEVLPTLVMNWLDKVWDISLASPRVQEQITALAFANSYNPIADYLGSLKWDGAARLDDWLVKYLRAEQVNDATGESIAGWVTRVGRMWVISMVARGLDPGCQVDTVPILEGRQGAGKTSTLRILGGPWYTDTKITLGEKDSYMAAGGSWVVELAEVAALKRGDLETVKAFLTAKEDTFRLPFGRAIGKYKRFCLFAGTTNDTEGYLVDPTGNRRFWPIRVGEVDKEALAAARDQLFAEAVVAYRAGEEWWFNTDDAAAFEEAVTSSRGPEADPYEELIQEWWPRSGNKTGWVTSTEIAFRGLGLSKDRISRAEQTRIGHAVKRLGWKKTQRTVDGVSRQWVYVAPRPAGTQSTRSATIVNIADAKVKKETT